jgi:integrase
MARRTFADLPSYVDTVYREKLDHLVEKGTISKETARTYISGVKQIAQRLQDQDIHSFRSIQAAEKVQAIFQELRRTKQFKDRTFNRMLAAMRHFSKTCMPGRTVLGGTMKANRISNDSRKRGHTERQKQHLNRNAKKLSGKKRIVYLTAKGSGLRYGEIARLTIDSFIEKNGELHIQVNEQKWGGKRTVPVSYLSNQELNELKGLAKEYLIGNNIGDGEVNKTMKVIGKIHDFRHDFARERFDQLMWEHGDREIALQQLAEEMGHNDVKTLAEYGVK